MNKEQLETIKIALENDDRLTDEEAFFIGNMADRDPNFKCSEQQAAMLSKIQSKIPKKTQ